MQVNGPVWQKDRGNKEQRNANNKTTTTKAKEDMDMKEEARVKLPRIVGRR